MQKQINKSNWHHFGQYIGPVIYYCLLHNWSQNDIAEDYNMPKLDGSLLMLNGHFFIYQEDWDTTKDKTKQALEDKDQNFFKNEFLLAEDMIHNLLEISQKLKFNSEIKIDLFQEWFEAMNNLEYPWILALPIDQAVKEFTQDKLENNNISKEKINYLFEPITSTPQMKQKRDLRRIKQKLKEENIFQAVIELNPKQALKKIRKYSPALHNKIINHIEQFKWIGMMHMWGNPFSVQKLFDQLKTLNLTEKVKNQELDLGENLSFIKKVAPELTYWRNCIAETCSKASYLSRSKFKETFNKLNLNWELGLFLSPNEFLRGLKGKNTPTKEELKERKQGYGLVPRADKLKIITGSELDKYTENMTNEVNSTNRITGETAHKGAAKGKVKVVLSPNEVDKINEGEILVVHETTPDFMPAVNKASAIIADVGGVTSHAAIISRELEKPCIINTKKGTRILEDGDEVQVNAGEGVIIILQ